MQKMILIFSFLMGVLALQGTTMESFGAQKWRDYFSYKECFDLLETDQWVVGATNLGLIVYDKETQSLSVLNKTNGLSDTELTAIGYFPALQMIVVSYQNGNIDLVEPDGITNIPDLKINNMSGSKSINSFLSVDDRLLCSTDFGLLVIDPKRKEIMATYYIGEEASSLKVFATAIDDEYIYAATAHGVLRASRHSDRLAYFQTWEQVSAQSVAYSDVEAFQEGYLAVRGEKGQSARLEYWHEGVVSTIGEKDFSGFWSLDMTPEGPVVVTGSKVYFYNSDLKEIRTLSTLVSGESTVNAIFRRTMVDSNGRLWVAIQNGGLFFEEVTNNWTQLLPPGPATNQVFTVSTAGDNLWLLPGGFSTSLNNGKIPASVSVLNSGGWTYFNRFNTPEFKNTVDLINMVVNPENPEMVLVASWGSGLFEFDALTLKTHYMSNNSGLQNIDWAGSRYTRVWGLDYDKNNNLWITNTSEAKGVVVLTSDGKWLQYSYASLATSDATGSILAGPEGYKWLLVHRGEAKGLFVFDNNQTIEVQNDDRYRGSIPPSEESDSRNAGQLLVWDENGEEITRDLYCMAFDKSGYLWLGTGNGIVVLYRPGSVFNSEKPVFSKIKVARDDGSGLADYLLENERITTMAVDGANRKYIGTQNSGLYLVSEDGTRTIATYNTGNSPLPSNVINHIHVNASTGEVFIATAKGLVSLQGDAVQGGAAFQNVHAYPNPVRSNFSGPITITGLMEESVVKITDTGGNLVYETRSLGGNAFWNGKNLWGKKVKPGIYIVLLSSSDGSQTAFTKIAIIR